MFITVASHSSIDHKLNRLGSVRSYAKHLRIDGVKYTIAVASCKGVVGKFITAVNLAVALASKCRLKVGLLDADVCGPNILTMMNINAKPEITLGSSGDGAPIPPSSSSSFHERGSHGLRKGRGGLSSLSPVDVVGASTMGQGAARLVKD
ncbi:P-loop containing nucleoside triphosphate hydrolase [Sesbania bispinosa]|nr:P-loop containing nucleoside triphosphate hydrolase [Sesbania bispinosa]